MGIPSKGKMKIINFLSQKEFALLTEIMKETGISYAYCKRYLRELEKEDIIEAVSIGRIKLFRLRKEKPVVLAMARLMEIVSSE